MLNISHVHCGLLAKQFFGVNIIMDLFLVASAFSSPPTKESGKRMVRLQ